MNRDEILNEIIDWWLSRKSIDKNSTMLKFDRANTRTTTIRIPAKMYFDACFVAKNDFSIKNFNRFVEIAIWEKLGSLDEYLDSNKYLPEQEN
jgi:hypothetical protein